MLHPEATKISVIYFFLFFVVFNLCPTESPSDVWSVVLSLSQPNKGERVDMGTGMQGNSFLIVFLLPRKYATCEVSGGVATTVKIKTLAHAAKFEMENKISQQDNHPYTQDIRAHFLPFCGEDT